MDCNKINAEREEYARKLKKHGVTVIRYPCTAPFCDGPEHCRLEFDNADGPIIKALFGETRSSLSVKELRRILQSVATCPR